MNITNEFLTRIKVLLDKKPSDDDFDDFNELESWFLDNEEKIHNENHELGQLGYKIQDEIAEMSYMEDNSAQRNNIRKIYEEMEEKIKNEARYGER